MSRGGADAFAAALNNVRRVVEELAYLPRKLAVEVAPDLTKLLRQEFEQGTDPYGRAWKGLRPSTLKKHGPPPLTDSGQLRDNTVAKPMTGGRAGLVITLGAAYGAFHQTGFRVGKTKVPARKVLPSQGMPKAWRTLIEQAAKRLAQRAGA